METLDLDTYRMLAMYGDGVHVADIANEFSVTVNTIYKRLKEHPAEYEEAKGKLAALRNAKYRRNGALAVDIVMETLETYKQKLKDPNTPEEEKQVIRNDIKKISDVGEAAERRADLNEGKCTEITEHRGPSIVMNFPDED